MTDNHYTVHELKNTPGILQYGIVRGNWTEGVE
jgi:hypothetical protein